MCYQIAIFLNKIIKYLYAECAVSCIIHMNINLSSGGSGGFLIKVHKMRSGLFIYAFLPCVNNSI